MGCGLWMSIKKERLIIFDFVGNYYSFLNCFEMLFVSFFEKL